MHRRRFLQTAAALTVMSTVRARAGARLPIAMAVEYNMLPTKISIMERFQLAKDCGFERIECPTTRDQGDAEKMKAAAEKTGLPIHSVMNMDHWAISVFVGRSGGGGKEPGRCARLHSQRAFVGSFHGASGACRGECADHIQRGL